MGLRFYDKAFIEKLKGWTAESNIHIYGPDDTKRLFEVIADEKNDKPIDLPIICLRRKSSINVTNTSKRVLTFDGITIDKTIPKSLQFNAIPITLSYQLDVYTRYFEEADEYVRNLIFNIINSPKLTINIPYHDENLELNGNLILNSDVEDTSNIPERLIPGQFTRFSMNVDIDDAYLVDLRVRDNWCIEVDLELENKNIKGE